jgi:phage terminase small subunit
LLGLDNLTAKQNLFCIEYLLDINATQAAIRAGYSPASAMEIGYQLLQKTSVQAEIKQLMHKRAERTELQADMILMELMKIAFLDITAAFDDKGRLLPVNAMPEDITRAIASLELIELSANRPHKESISKTGFRLSFCDKLKALELLGRHLGLFNNKVHHDVGATLEELVAASFNRQRSESTPASNK